jgi:predicted  nucleic acid-binding Zn-ribbon protein
MKTATEVQNRIFELQTEIERAQGVFEDTPEQRETLQKLKNELSVEIGVALDMMSVRLAKVEQTLKGFEKYRQRMELKDEIDYLSQLRVAVETPVVVS